VLEPVFTPEQIAELEKPLDNNDVKHRQGGGGVQLNYLAGYQVINRANKLFGFGRWGYDLISVELQNVLDENGQILGCYYSARVKVTVKDCVPVTDEGVCPVQEGRNPRARIDAHDMARKGAITDAMKRAFRCFGDQFGNSLYDKDYDATTGLEPKQPTAPTRQQAATQATRPTTTQNQPTPISRPAPAQSAPRPAQATPAKPVTLSPGESPIKPPAPNGVATFIKNTCPEHGTAKLKYRMVTGETGPQRMLCCLEEFCDYMVAV
jgi:DNA repair and recombination protein RAD52